MSQHTDGPCLTEEELRQLREKLPLLLKVIGILEAEAVVIDDGITVDDRSRFLDLLLPHISNRLDKDMPRLRETLEKLDAFAKDIDAALTGEVKNREDVARSIRKELSDGDAAVLQTSAEALRTAVEAEAEARQARDDGLAASLADETAARERAAREHEADPGAHDALVRRITAGDVSPVIGVCLVESGNYSGLWYNVDAEGQPVAPPKRYFDHHPVYAGMRRVLVDGQVMVEQPAFWIKHLVPSSGPFAGKRCKILSPGQQDGFRPYPAFLDARGNPLSKIYIGAFLATNEGGNPAVAGSRPGKMPLVNINFDTARQYCANRNTGGVSGFHLFDVYEWSALQTLFLTEYCDSESQGILGRGHADGAAAVRTDYETLPCWRGYTGLYSNVWQFLDGLRLTPSRQIEMFRNDGSRTYVNTGKIAPSFDGTNVAFITALHSGDGDGFCMDDVFLPLASSISEEQGLFPDGFWGGWSNTGNITLIGGDWVQSVRAGLFCLNWNNALSNAGPNVGCRSAKH